MKYVDQDPMEFCLEYNIKVEPRNHCIFVRHGVVEVSEKYEHHDCKSTALVAALNKLCEEVRVPLDPKIGRFSRATSGA